jgi:hypothetical protein
MRYQLTHRTVGKRVLAATSLDRILALARARVGIGQSQPTAVTIHVALADRTRARSIGGVLAREMALRASALGLVLPPRTVLLVDRSVRVGGEAVGSSLEIAPRPDGSERIVLRLALDEEERQRDTDELLADLDHQLLVLHYRRVGEPSSRFATRQAKRSAEGDWERRLSLRDASDDRTTRHLADDQKQPNGTVA